MKLSQDQIKKEVDKFEKRFPLLSQRYIDNIHPLSKGRYENERGSMLSAWLASRENVEVELPSPFEVDNGSKDDFKYFAANEIIPLIESQGFTVVIKDEPDL